MYLNHPRLSLTYKFVVNYANNFLDPLTQFKYSNVY